jgi:predicted enzyme related to lactoylglutathione lyase
MKVTGIGGIFFKAKDPELLREWYKDKLGIDYESWGSVFFWKEQPSGSTSFSIFKEDSTYYEKSFMINFRVDELIPLLEKLKAEGVAFAGEMQEESYGKFAWIYDLEDNRIELWEPIDEAL